MKLQMDSGNFSALVEIEVDGEAVIGEGDNASTVQDTLYAAGIRLSLLELITAAL